MARGRLHDPAPPGTLETPDAWPPDDRHGRGRDRKRWGDALRRSHSYRTSRSCNSEARRPPKKRGPRGLVAPVRTGAGTLIQTAPVAKLAIGALWAVHSDFQVAVAVRHRREVSTPAERLFDRRRLCRAFLAVEHWPFHSSIRERGNGLGSYGESSAYRVARRRGLAPFFEPVTNRS